MTQPPSRNAHSWVRRSQGMDLRWPRYHRWQAAATALLCRRWAPRSSVSPKFSIWSQRMARVTVEDCVQKVPNRFELVLLAAQRAREITSGASLTLDRDDDKNPVIALREIAEDTVGLEHLRSSVVRGLQKHVE